MYMKTILQGFRDKKDIFFREFNNNRACLFRIYLRKNFNHFYNRLIDTKNERSLQKKI